MKTWKATFKDSWGNTNELRFQMGEGFEDTQENAKNRAGELLAFSYCDLVRVEELSLLGVVYCIHCGRVYVVDRDCTTRGDTCDCGAELYPVERKVMMGEELRGGDNMKIRACIPPKDA